MNMPTALQNNQSNEIDVTAISWVVGEIRETLQRAENSLQTFLDSKCLDETALRQSKNYLHQVYGVFQVIAIDGVAVLIEEVEQVLEQNSTENQYTEALHQIVVRALRAVVDYMSELIQGMPHRPVRLFPYYKELLEAKSVKRIHPADLFFPDLSIRPPKEEPTETFTPELLAEARAKFERALLGFLRNIGDAASVNEMAQVLTTIEGTQRSSPHRAFWYSTRALFEGMTQGSIPVDINVQRLSARINLQMKRLVEGDNPPAERLLKDTLFFIARARNPSPLINQVRELYSLKGAVPDDFEQDRYGKGDKDALRQAGEILENVKEQWNQVVGGAPEELGNFAVSVMSLRDAFDRLQQKNLSELTHELAIITTNFEQTKQIPNEVIGIEVATTLLFIESALQNLQVLGQDFADRVKLLIVRLQAVFKGQAVDDKNNAPWLDDMARQAQERVSMISLVTELESGLHNVEKTLDDFFRDSSQLSEVKACTNQLKQIAGAFSILGQLPAAELVHELQNKIDAFDESVSIDNNKDAFERIAAEFGALGFLAENIKHRPETASVPYQFNQASCVFVQDKMIKSRWAEEYEASLPFEMLLLSDATAEAQLGASNVKVLAADEIEGLVSVFHSSSSADIEFDQLSAEYWESNSQSFYFMPSVATASSDTLESVDEGRKEHTPIASVLDVVQDESSISLTDTAVKVPEIIVDTPLVEPTASVKTSEPATQIAQVTIDSVDAELLEIFLCEAQEVLQTIEEAYEKLVKQTNNQEVLTEIRRAFHTLKGSSRMVGLNAFGEAGWALEQTMNKVLASRQSATPDLLTMVHVAQTDLADWVKVLTEVGHADHTPDYLIALAEAVRNGTTLPSKDTAVIAVPDVIVPDVSVVDVAPSDEIEVLLESSEPIVVVESAPEDTTSAVSAENQDGQTTETVTTHPLNVQSNDVEMIQIGNLNFSKPLYQIFLTEAKTLLQTLNQAVATWQKKKKRTLQPTTLRALHSLCGISATVNLQVMNELADILEHALISLQNQLQALSGNDLTLILRAVDVLQQQVNIFEAGDIPERNDELLSDIKQLLDRHVGKAQVAPEASVVTPEVLPPFIQPESIAQTLVADNAIVLDKEKALNQLTSTVPVSPVKSPTETAAPSALGSLILREDIQDDLDQDLLPIFLEEAADMLPQVGTNLRAWQTEPNHRSHPQSLLRLLHTIKGSARMAGAMRLGQLTHDMETRVEAVMTLPSMPPGVFDDLLAAHDLGLLLFESLSNPDITIPLPVSSDAGTGSTTGHQALLPELTVATPLVSTGGAGVAQPAAQQAMVRVRADILDRLVNQAGEVSIARSRVGNELSNIRGSLTDLADNLERMRGQLREIEIQAESQMQSSMILAKDHQQEFDPLEFDRFTRFQEVTRMLAESVNDVAMFQSGLLKGVESAQQGLLSQTRNLRELQQDLMSIRMVQFGSISERLYRVVRRAAKELDKRVNLDIRGARVELDRSVLERMVGPFEHILRNALVHGIETREQRQKAGKSETGEILVEVRHEGGEVVITISDDGAGLNYEKIRERGVLQGLIAATQEVSNAELAELIFEPGFSTASSITELAGRGVGMDVVKHETIELGGLVQLDSTPNKGSRFTINLPLTLAVTQVTLVKVGDQQYAIPSVLIEQVQQVKPQHLATAYEMGSVEWSGERIGLRYLATLLGDSSVVPVSQKFSPVIILRSGVQRFAIHVDSIAGSIEAVVKNVGTQISRMQGITGATILGSGDIVLILNPVQLAQRPIAEVRAQLHDEAIHPEHHIPQQLQTLPTVMVVDDSLTVRKVTQRLLEREGYQVLLAKDGVDALRQMQDFPPDVMLVDIEMPRMDGFDLTRNVRGDSRFAKIPIIMITSRTADKHRNYALSLGVNEYLGKPYREDELLTHIQTFLAKSKSAGLN